jgi:phage shock protein C
MIATGEVRRLYKSRTERMIDGICGGVAEYFNLDPTLVRLAWVLLALLGGTGIFLYVVGMILMPVAPVGTTTTFGAKAPSHRANSAFWGILLVAVGILWLMSNLGFGFWHRWWGLSWDMALPALLIMAGVAFLFGGRNYVSGSPISGSMEETGQSAAGAASPQPAAATRLQLSRSDRKISGVCGGLAAFLNTDPTIVRVLFVIAAFASFGFMILLYLLMAILVPREPVAPQMT